MTTTHCPHCGMPLADNDRAAGMIEAVADSFGMPVDVLLGESRQSAAVQARHMAMLVVREMTVLSYPQIGKLFGRNHSTVMYGCEQARVEVERGGWLSDLYERVTRRLIEQGSVAGIQPQVGGKYIGSSPPPKA